MLKLNGISELMYQRPEMGAIFMQKMQKGDRSMDFGIAGIAAITVLCYLAGGWCKDFEKINDKYIPEICGTAGVILGIVGLFVMPDFPAQDVITAAAVGAVSGLAAVGVNQCVKQSKK